MSQNHNEGKEEPHNWITLLWFCLIQSRYWELLDNLIMDKGCALELILPVPKCFIPTTWSKWTWCGWELKRNPDFGGVRTGGVFVSGSSPLSIISHLTRAPWDVSLTQRPPHAGLEDALRPRRLLGEEVWWAGTWPRVCEQGWVLMACTNNSYQ